jgi:peptidoglycan/LPS O-acetylase OafA/YrhL
MVPGLFRLVLATVVVFDHFSRLAIGPTAVNLFFLLSGFWIYRMFRGKYSASDNPAGVFIASRMMRLLPMFIIFNTLAMVLNIFLKDQTKPGSLSIIPNVLIIGYSSLANPPFPPGWSLDVELQFYIIFPIIFVMMPYFEGKFILVVSMLLLAGGSYFVLLAMLQFATIGTVLPFAGFFLLGTFSARNGWKPPRYVLIVSLISAVLILSAILVVPDLRGLLVRGVSDREIAFSDAVNFGLALVLAPVALSTVYDRSSPRDRVVGDMSYVVYCSHWLARMIAKHYLSDVGRIAKIPYVLALIAATYAVSLLVLLYIDLPLSRWPERWVSRQIQRTVAEP